MGLVTSNYLEGHAVRISVVPITRVAGSAMHSKIDRPRIRSAPRSTRRSAYGDEMNWSVTVEVDSRRVVTISHNHLAGDEKLNEEAIRIAAHHLLAFIGDPPPPETNLDLTRSRVSGRDFR